jgi:hypothetical protein
MGGETPRPPQGLAIVGVQPTQDNASHGGAGDVARQVVAHSLRQPGYMKSWRHLHLRPAVGI